MKKSTVPGFKWLTYSILFIISLGLFLTSCKKSNSAADVISPAPVINSITPDHGGINSMITIYGSNFSSDISLDVVKFNGVLAHVLNATGTRITVELPAGCGTGNVTAKVNNSVETQGPLFTYEYRARATTIVPINNDPIMNYPVGVAVDDQDNIYVLDQSLNRILKITSAGVASILAGSEQGSGGYINGMGTVAAFRGPTGIKLDQQGNVFVCDRGNNVIRKITPAGLASTYAGNGNYGYVQGPVATAEFKAPQGITFDSQGNMFITDSDNWTVRQITTDGIVSTFSANAPLSNPNGLFINSQGYAMVIDMSQKKLFALNRDGSYGYWEGLNAPVDVIADANEHVYVSDRMNNQVVQLVNNTFVTVVGNGLPGHVDGIGNHAQFSYPSGMAFDKHGNLFIADSGNRMIRKVVFE